MTEAELVDWVHKKLSTPLKQFNNLPACPFAGKALLSQEVALLNSPLDILHACDLLESKTEVVVYWFDPNKITPAELETQCNKINENHPDLIALEDHPDYPEDVDGYNLNQGTWALILIQNRKKLAEARKKLSALGYYKNWSQDYLRDVQDR